MKSDFSVFERRMEMLYIILNNQMITCRELARRFSVSDETISRELTALSRFAPICIKQGRYGGVYILDGYKHNKVYLTRDEEDVIEELIEMLSGHKKHCLQMVLYKFAMPKK